MSDTKKSVEVENDSSSNEEERKYYFGGITEYKLEDIEAEVLNDNVYLDVFAGSDVRFKEEIKKFDGALDLISNLDVYKYEYNTKDFAHKNFPAGEQIGLMAQDLKAQLPRLVKEDEQGFGHVNYAGLTPVLLAGIQELMSVTEKQARHIESLETSIKALEEKLSQKN